MNINKDMFKEFDERPPTIKRLEKSVERFRNIPKEKWTITRRKIETIEND